MGEQNESKKVEQGKEKGKGENTTMSDFELHAGEGKPVKVSLGAYVLIQIVMGGVLFGGVYTTIKRDIETQGKALEEMQKKREELMDFQREALQRLTRIETKMENMDDKLRFIRTASKKTGYDNENE